MSKIKSHYPSLFPTSSNDYRPIKEYGVVDIEATKWINYLIGGYYTKHYKIIKDGKQVLDREFLHETLELFEDLHEFCDWLFEDAQPHNDIYAHYGGKFDFQYFMEPYYLQRDTYYIDNMIPRGAMLLCFSVSTMKIVSSKPQGKDAKKIIRQLKDGKWLIKNRTITFRDSSAMLPFSLANLTTNFGVEHKKQEIDYEAMTVVTPEIKEYLEYDLRGLYEVIEKYFTWPLIRGAGSATTIASQSMRVFQTYLEKPIRSLDDDVDAFVRKSYFGGRTEIFRPLFDQVEDNQLLSSYDVNSLYPSMMLANDFPTNLKKITTDTIDFSELGFYDVDVEVPEMYVPPLGHVFSKNGRLIFPTGYFRGVFSSIELEYAETQGVKIRKVHSGMIFHNGGPIFKEYITDIYEMRLKSKKASVDNILTKLIMNSTYGRFGIRRDREMLMFEDFFSDGTSSVEDFSSDAMDNLLLMTKDIHLDEMFGNVAVAAWVTSLSRIHMHKLYMLAPDELFYTDTDSIYSTYAYLSDDKTLGALKYEHSYRRGSFLLPKTYLLESNLPHWIAFDEKGKPMLDEKGNPIRTNKKSTMKGFSSRKISHLQFEDFNLAREGDMRMMRASNPEKFATFRTALNKKKFRVLLKEAPRQIQSSDKKRRYFKRHYAQIWDTEPLHIKNGEIVNLDN
jgi:hypothetical protein